MTTTANAGSRTAHSRRAEINARLVNQDRRIHQERKEGEITADQAHDVHAEDRDICAQELYDASLHNYP